MNTLMMHKMKSWVAAVACLALASCVNDKEGDCTDPASPWKSDIWLSVSIHNLATFSRADNPPADGEEHPDEAALDAENYINTSDVNILLFDKDKRLIRTFDNSSYTLTPQSPGVYNLSVKASSDFFDYAGTADDAMVECSVMVVANLNGTGQGDRPFEFNNSAMIFKPLTALSELYRGFPYTGTAGTDAWQPSVPENRLIPMSGIATASFTRAALNAATTEAAALQLPAIYIQRAMAKVRLVNAMEANNVTGYEITSVTLSGSNSRGTYLPLLTESSEWAENTAVLEYGTALPQWYSDDQLPSTMFTFTDRDNTVGKGAGNQYDAYRVYLPEFDWNVIGTNHGPTLNISVFSTAENKTYNFTYSFPRTVKDSAGNDIDGDFARNHIYQVVVTGVSTTQPVTLQTFYTVCPWSTRSATIPPFD